MFSSVAILVISTTLLLLSPLLGNKQNSNFEKGTPFECGFDPLGSGQLNFSIRFFLIAVVFMIFDVEIALLLPLVVTTLSGNYMIWVFNSVVFLLVLTLGTFFEWKEGALEWK
uniref:NADH-ubiquinone oxidoreductase chain 3 n=1 Tax=Trachelipus rathkii TaxID=1720764 RepID=A0A0G2T4L0_9CRUS|nr:NADH dehydrogenase subunit 3 [Trachelipus rathkii]ASN74433.1 NADH dehydrogenase subunit 3 [Trachelipus rathkii]